MAMQQIDTDSSQETAQITAQKTAQKLSASVMKTLQAIQDNPNITIAEIKAVTGLSERTIKTHQVLLKKDGYIQRVGRGRMVVKSLIINSPLVFGRVMVRDSGDPAAHGCEKEAWR